MSPLLSIDHKCLFFLYTCIQHHGNKRKKSKKKRKQIGTVYFRAKTTWNERIVDSSSQKNWKSEAACLCLEMQNNKKIKMLGDIAPIISLLQHYTARLQTPWLDRKFGKSLCYWPHSLNWFQRDPQFAWRKLTHWNSTWVSIILAQLTLFVFEMFDFRSSPLYVYIFWPIPLCFFALWAETSTPSPQFCFQPKTIKKNQDFRNGWGFSVLEACFTKIQKFFSEKTKKRRLFFLQKSVNTKKFPSKLWCNKIDSSKAIFVVFFLLSLVSIQNHQLQLYFLRVRK